MNTTLSFLALALISTVAASAQSGPGPGPGVADPWATPFSGYTGNCQRNAVAPIQYMACESRAVCLRDGHTLGLLVSAHSACTYPYYVPMQVKTWWDPIIGTTAGPYKISGDAIVYATYWTGIISHAWGYAVCGLPYPIGQETGPGYGCSLVG